MIMLNPNKGRVTTIVAAIKQKRGGGQPSHPHEPSYEEEREEKPESDQMAAKMAAMDSLCVAIEKRDAKAMVRAMKTFLELCQYEGGEEDEEERDQNDHKDQPAYSSPQYGSKSQEY